MKKIPDKICITYISVSYNWEISSITISLDKGHAVFFSAYFFIKTLHRNEKKNCSMIFVWTINPQGLLKSQNLSRETLLQSVWVGLWCWNVSQMENPRLLFIGSTQLMVKVSCWEVLKSIYEPPWQKKKEKKKRHFSNLWKSSFSHNFSHCRDKQEQRMTRFAPICIRNVKFINDIIAKYTFLSSYSS